MLPRKRFLLLLNSVRGVDLKTDVKMCTSFIGVSPGQAASKMFTKILSQTKTKEGECTFSLMDIESKKITTFHGVRIKRDTPLKVENSKSGTFLIEYKNKMTNLQRKLKTKQNVK